MSMQNDSGQKEEEVFEWMTWVSASNASNASNASKTIAHDRTNIRRTTRTRKAPLHQ